MAAALFLVACSDDSASGGSGPGGSGGSGGAGASGGDGGTTTDGGSGPGGGTEGGGGQGGEPPMELVHTAGRLDISNPDAPAFIWPGTSFGTHIEGTGLNVRLGGAQNAYFQIVVDGSSTGVFRTDGGDADYTLVTDLPAGPHDIEIVQRNESYGGALTFLGFTPHEGTQIVPTPSPYVHTMEFIGDSITCGYGNEGQPGCNFSAETESAYATYAAITARNVGAAAHLVASSGRGMHQNCCGDTGPVMPELYLRTLIDDEATPWDFSRFTPEVVVVNLGTNDFNSNVDDNAFKADYVAFLGLLRSTYPDATLVCVAWPIWGASNADLVQQAVDETADPNVLTIQFDWDTLGDGVGCDGHPNTTTHAKLGQALTDLLTEELGW